MPGTTALRKLSQENGYRDPVSGKQKKWGNLQFLRFVWLTTNGGRGGEYRQAKCLFSDIEGSASWGTRAQVKCCRLLLGLTINIYYNTLVFILLHKLKCWRWSDGTPSLAALDHSLVPQVRDRLSDKQLARQLFVDTREPGAKATVAPKGPCPIHNGFSLCWTFCPYRTWWTENHLQSFA